MQRRWLSRVLHVAHVTTHIRSGSVSQVGFIYQPLVLTLLTYKHIVKSIPTAWEPPPNTANPWV